MLKWKKCPKCGRRIPENWNRHDKCGWNAEELKTGAETKRDEFIEEMEKSLIDSFDVIRRIKQKVPTRVHSIRPNEDCFDYIYSKKKRKIFGNEIKI
jgi:hypothetical protein